MSDVRIPLLNREEEVKQRKCEEIDEQLETLETYVCDSLCCHRQEKLSQEEMDWYCYHCKLQEYADQVRKACIK